MAVMIALPQMGNTVESVILLRWHKQVGEPIAVGEALCEVETDKASMEVESTAAGTILKLLYNEGDEIPVLVDLAVVGAPGETPEAVTVSPTTKTATTNASNVVPQTTAPRPPAESPILTNGVKISPRARKLAERSQIDIHGLTGTGPEGRVIERDVQAAIQAAQTAAANAPKMTPLARAMVTKGDFQLPEDAQSAGRRITSKDLTPAARESEPAAPIPASTDQVEIIPLKGTRKIIAARMLQSLQTTAQLTLTSYADARALRAIRTRLKTFPVEMGLRDVTINDLVLYAVSRTLTHFLDLNTLFQDGAMHRYKSVNLGMAVDTERGLIVPVIRDAHTKSLKALSDEAHQLAAACLNGSIKPDDLNGGTFTVTNLGSLGIEVFTPVLNPPQVGILGVGAILPRVIETPDGIDFIPQISLSLTINHQVVDGAPGARFLQALCRTIAQLDLSIITG